MALNHIEKFKRSNLHMKYPIPMSLSQLAKIRLDEWSSHSASILNDLLVRQQLPMLLGCEVLPMNNQNHHRICDSE